MTDKKEIQLELLWIIEKSLHELAKTNRTSGNYRRAINDVRLLLEELKGVISK